MGLDLPPGNRYKHRLFTGTMQNFHWYNANSKNQHMPV